MVLDSYDGPESLLTVPWSVSDCVGFCSETKEALLLEVAT